MKRICKIAAVLCLSAPLFALSVDEQFINACMEGDLKRATELLDDGAHLDARDGSDHQTALVWAANAGYLPIVTMLIKRGADINAQDDKGWTALSEASYRGRTSIVDFLLQNKASTLPSTSWLDSREYGNAVFWCIESRFNSYSEKIEIVKLLLEHNAEPEGKDEYGQDALGIAKARNYKEIVALLEKVKAERIKKQNEYALLEAIRAQDTAKVKLYLEKKVNPNSLLPNGESILNYAVSAQNVAIVKILLEAGANPNTQNELGSSALMTAVRHNNDALLNLLIKHGVNLNQKDNRGRTVLFYAVENNNSSILTMLIRTGANINVTDNYGINAFLYACSLGNIPACKSLLHSGCQASCKDIYGTTALHIAAQKGSLALLRLLLTEGNVDIYAKDDRGNSALYYARKNGNTEITTILEGEIEE